MSDLDEIAKAARPSPTRDRADPPPRRNVPAPGLPAWAWAIVVVGSLAFVGAMLKAIGTGSREPPAGESPAQPSLPVAFVADAGKLLVEYQTSRAEADANITGKIIEVDGFVGVNTEDARNSALGLYGEDGRTPFGVLCTFDDIEGIAPVFVHVGDYVRVRGKCMGWFAGNVAVLHCRLLEKRAADAR